MRSSKKIYRNPKILFYVTDVEGSLWGVRQIRETKHGFDLLFGSPESHLGAYRGGLPRLIATQELRDFWEANSTKHDGIMYDLPAGRSTLKRVRRRLGRNYLKDRDRFWSDHLEELRTLTPRQFAARYGIDPSMASDARLRWVGRTARPLGWWQNQEPLQVLQSKLTLREMGEKLSISTSQAHRLRRRAQLPAAA